MQCENNVEQLAFAALSHETAITFFPTGGWDKVWLGHPDRGFGQSQPGGWILQHLAVHRTAIPARFGGDRRQHNHSRRQRERLATPLPGLNCPSRRPAALYRLAYGIQF